MTSRFWAVLEDCWHAVAKFAAARARGCHERVLRAADRLRVP